MLIYLANIIKKHVDKNSTPNRKKSVNLWLYIIILAADSQIKNVYCYEKNADSYSLSIFDYISYRL